MRRCKSFWLRMAEKKLEKKKSNYELSLIAFMQKKKWNPLEKKINLVFWAKNLILILEKKLFFEKVVFAKSFPRLGVSLIKPLKLFFDKAFEKK